MMVRLFLSVTCLRTSLYAYVVHTCPTTRVTWIARSNVVKCDKYREELYHCFRNQSGELEELCHKSEVANPSKGCPYFSDSNQLMHFRCRGDLRCPQRGDPYFYTSELFIYPGCLQRLAKTTPFRTTVQISTLMINTNDESTLTPYERISTHGLLSKNLSEHGLVAPSSMPMVYHWIGLGALVVTIISCATCNILKRKKSATQKQPEEAIQSMREETRVNPHDAIDQDPRICSQLNTATTRSTVNNCRLNGYKKYSHSNITGAHVNEHFYEETENESSYENNFKYQDQYRRKRKMRVTQKQPEEAFQSKREETRVNANDAIDQDLRISSQLNTATTRCTANNCQLNGYEEYSYSNNTEEHVNEHVYEETENESIYVNDV